jgi:thymidylate synthase (FAD)
MNPFPVLDKGFVHLLEKFGDELTIVNCARVSFGKTKDELDDSDKKLIKYLLNHKHTSPFRHVFFRFHIKAPEFVMRQWFKHVVGIEWTSNSSSQLHGWNEISGRYVAMHEYYFPDHWRKQSENKKQGSDGLVNDQCYIKEKYTSFIKTMETLYEDLLRLNVAKEQARILIPLSVYTECIWTVSLQALMNFVLLRDAEDAQFEIREYAKVFTNILKIYFPTCLSYFENA